MKKIDIMNNINPAKPGTPCEWQIIGGKVTRGESFIPEAIVNEKVEKEKVEEVVKDVYGEVQIVPEGEELKPHKVDMKKLKELQKKKVKKVW